MGLISHWQTFRGKALTIFLTVGLQIGFMTLPVVWSLPLHAQLTCRKLFAPQAESKRQSPEANVLAVHLTDYFPYDGFVRASPENSGRFGVTLHFALGQPVIDHAQGNWSKRKYGVVLPLHAMRDQVLNLFPQDTFVLGDVKLPREAVVFVPATDKVPAGLPCKVVQYDVGVGLKNTISRYIRESGTIPIYATNGLSYSEVLLRGRNMNDPVQSKSFFQGLYEEKPYISTTTHEYTPWGRVDYEVIDFVASWMKTGKSERPRKISDVYLGILKIQDSLAEATKVSKQMALPEQAKKSWQAGLKALEGPLNLIHVDYALRKAHGVSILETDFSANPTLHERLKQAMPSRHSLQKLCEENLGVLAAASKDQGEISLPKLSDALWYTDLPAYKAKLRMLFANPTPEKVTEVNHQIVIKALNLLIEGKIPSETALAEWNARVENMNFNRFRLSNIDRYIKLLVQEQKGEINPEVVKFFSSPAVKERLARTYELYRNEYSEKKPGVLGRFDAIFGTR